MSRISTLSANNQLIRLMQQGQVRMQEKQVQLATEKNSPIYAGVAQSSERLINTENTRELLNNYNKTNALMDMRLNITGTVLKGVDDALSSFRRELISFQATNTTDVLNVRDIQNSAFTTLKSIESYLNTSVNGEYLFSGGRVTTQPVDLGLTTLSALQTKYDGANITYPTYRDNNVHHKMTASTGNPTNPTGAGFTNLSFNGTANTITTANLATQVNTITLSGSVQAGDVYSVNVNGTDVSYTVTGSEANMAAVRDNFFAAINANATVSASVTAAASSTDAITITSDVAGTAFTSTSTSTNLTAVAQIDNVTLANTYATNDTVSVNVNGLGAVTYTVVANDLTANGDGTGGTVAGNSTTAFNNITTKVAAAINANAASAEIVTAAASGGGGGIITLTADTAGTAFTNVTSASTAGNGTATATTATNNLPASTDNKAITAITTANANAFANLTVGASITISGANTAGNNGTYTIATNSAGVITVAAGESIATTDNNDAGLTLVSNISYFSGDEITQSHNVNKTRSFVVDLTGIDPAFEKAIRALFHITQGAFNTGGGLDQNTSRVGESIYLLESALDRNPGGAAPFGTELTGSIEQASQDIGYDRVLINQTNTTNQSLIDFFDTRISEIEDVDTLEIYTKLVDQQAALEASYQAMARVRQLSLAQFLS
jgi:flagellar hook-associated protein 3 FlgL